MMGDNSGANGAPGHFNNDTNRHRLVHNRRNNIQGLYLYNQEEPYTGEEMPTIPVQINTIFGQARLVPIDPQTLDLEPEGDGSVSIPYDRQNGRSICQQENHMQAVANTQLPDSACPVNPSVPEQQSRSSPCRETRPRFVRSLSVGDHPSNFTYHTQSCSGLSDVNINRIALQLQEVPSADSSAVQLHIQEVMTTRTCAQQAITLVSEDDVGPVNVEAPQADLSYALGANNNRGKEQILMPQKYPQQCSEAIAAENNSDQGIIFPPNHQNNEYVRAERTRDLANDQVRTESKIPGNRGGASAAVRLSSGSSLHRSSSSLTLSSRFRTARGLSMAQGGGDRDSASFVSAAQPGPRHQEYSNLQSRFGSFLKMPTTVTQSARSLAEAGMFYAGYKDTCRCFFCGGDLHSWAQDDDPWQEHARYYPNCGFVRKEKGQRYIDSVKLAFSKDETKVKDTQSGKLDVKERDAIVQRIEEMGYGREKILLSIGEYQRRVQAGLITSKPDKTSAILDILLDMGTEEKTSNFQGQRENSSSGNARNGFDYTLCSACKIEKASISQRECGHIVCKGCAPPEFAEKQVHRCRLCGREVVDAWLIDTSLM